MLYGTLSVCATCMVRERRPLQWVPAQVVERAGVRNAPHRIALHAAAHRAPPQSVHLVASCPRHGDLRTLYCADARLFAHLHSFAAPDHTQRPHRRPRAPPKQVGDAAVSPPAAAPLGSPASGSEDDDSSGSEEMGDAGDAGGTPAEASLSLDAQDLRLTRRLLAAEEAQLRAFASRGHAESARVRAVLGWDYLAEGPLPPSHPLAPIASKPTAASTAATIAAGEPELVAEAFARAEEMARRRSSTAATGADGTRQWVHPAHSSVPLLQRRAGAGGEVDIEDVARRLHLGGSSDNLPLMVCCHTTRLCRTITMSRASL